MFLATDGEDVNGCNLKKTFLFASFPSAWEIDERGLWFILSLRKPLVMFFLWDVLGTFDEREKVFSFS